MLLDCDPGIDDALAILLALGASKRIDVKAIVSTFGNVGLGQTKDNLLRILSLFDKKPLIGAGSKAALNGRPPMARHVHGQDGLGGLAFQGAPRYGKSAFKRGIDLILRLALSNKIDVIIATGPLTDLARAIKKEPRFLKKVHEIIIMGGAVFVEGNVTPYAEFNFYCDPEAARIVLNSGVNKTLVSLDVTRKALLKRRLLNRLEGSVSPISIFIRHLAEYSIMSNRKRGFDGAPMHDPLAVGLAIDEGLGRYERLGLDVKTSGKEKGRAVLKNGKPNVKFCKKVDTKGFFDLFIGTLIKVCKENRNP